MMSRVSSAYWIIGKLVVYPIFIGTLSRPMSFALLTDDYKRSGVRTKSKGDNESPCLIPLL
jgi:hypothetical protein